MSTSSAPSRAVILGLPRIRRDGTLFRLFYRTLSLSVAFSLHFATLSRQWLIHPRAVLAGWQWICRAAGFATGLAAIAPHAVSGASATIVSPLTARATNGLPFKYRILTSPYAANSFQAVPQAPRAALPLGLVLEPDPAGIIDGTPREEGVWSIQLTASEAGRPDRTTYATLTLTVVANPNQPPSISVQPRSVTVTNGDPAVLSVVASRVGAQGYQWFFNDLQIPGARSALLSFATARPTNAGNYRVVATNAYGSVTSAVAVLTVLDPTPVPLTLVFPILEGGRLRFQLSGAPGGGVVISSSSDLIQWSPVATNTLSTPGGRLDFIAEPDPSGAARFFRAAGLP